MERWEYILLSFEPHPHYPQRIIISPSGVIDLQWLCQRFGVRVVPRQNEWNIDIIDKLFKKAPDVSMALLQYLGLNGWEMVGLFDHLHGDSKQYGTYDIFFKRPVVNSS